MIHVVYSAPCEYNRKQRGMGEALIGHTGEDPVKVAKRYLGQIQGSRLYSVYKDGVEYYMSQYYD